MNKVRARWPPGSTRRLMVVPSFGRSHYEFVQTPTPPHTSLLTSSCLLSISLCISACFVLLARCTRRGCGDGDGDGDALFVCGRRARRRNHASPRRAAGSMAANLLGKAGRGHSRVLCHDDFFLMRAPTLGTPCSPPSRPFHPTSSIPDIYRSSPYIRATGLPACVSPCPAFPTVLSYAEF